MHTECSFSTRGNLAYLRGKAGRVSPDLKSEFIDRQRVATEIHRGKGHPDWHRARRHQPGGLSPWIYSNPNRRSGRNPQKCVPECRRASQFHGEASSSVCVVLIPTPLSRGNWLYYLRILTSCSRSTTLTVVGKHLISET